MRKVSLKYQLLLIVGALSVAAGVLAAAGTYTAATHGDRLFPQGKRTLYAYSGEMVTEAGIQLTSDMPLDDAQAQGCTSQENIEPSVDINNAGVWELSGVLPGVGEAIAGRIVDYRETVGGFRSVDELIEVEGIGVKLLEKIRPYCFVGEYTSGR